MKKLLFFLLIMVAKVTAAQADTTKWIRAFPITNYVVDLTDSIKLVQLYLPAGPSLKEMQPSVLRGVYKDEYPDTLTIGPGRCHLIKGDYYYFTVNHNRNGRMPKEHDLLYTVVSRPQVYNELFIRIASHYIELQNVYEEPFYDRYGIFVKWTQEDENAVIDSMVNDIRFTGQYFMKNDPAMDKLISTGVYTGRKVFSLMITCDQQHVRNFLRYMIAKPRLFAGRYWKISELFATWLHGGAPTGNGL